MADNALPAAEGFDMERRIDAGLIVFDQGLRELSWRGTIEKVIREQPLPSREHGIQAAVQPSKHLERRSAVCIAPEQGAKRKRG
jgi:hypothetical protein